MYHVLLLWCICSAAWGSLSAETTAYVCVPVANIRSEPTQYNAKPGHRTIFPSDPAQQTQVLYGDRVLVEDVSHGNHHDFVLVAIPTQRELSREGEWQSYRGWVDKASLTAERPDSHLYVPTIVTKKPHSLIFDTPTRNSKQQILLRASAGTTLYATYYNQNWWRVRLLDGSHGFIHHDDCVSYEEINKLSLTELRDNIVATAHTFLNMPYAWGGCSAFDASTAFSQITSVDCSSLIYLAYRINGIMLPRDAHPQYMWGRPIEPHQLKPGDLVFLANESTKQMVHVLMYLGEEGLIDADGTFPHQVVLSNFHQRFNGNKNEFHDGDLIPNISYRTDDGVIMKKNYYIYFRTYL